MPSQIEPQRTKAREHVAPHRVLNEFYGSPEARPAFVRGLFDTSAHYYEGLSAALSFGTDRFYRKLVLRRAGLRPGMRMLDVATGTGLVARAALQLGVPARDIIGLDPSRGMLQENQRRHSITLIQGVGEQLPLRDGVFDFVTMGYALRHVEDLGRLFVEFRRVLKPGGRVLILELTRPQSALAFSAMRIYMHSVLPVLTRLVTRRAMPAQLLQYYWATIAECVPPTTILDALHGAGLKEVRRQRTGSVLSEYYASKP